MILNDSEHNRTQCNHLTLHNILRLQDHLLTLLRARRNLYSITRKLHQGRIVVNTGSNIVLQLTALLHIYNFYNCVYVTIYFWGAGQDLLGSSVHGLGQVTHVGRGYAGDRDSPVLGQVDAVVSGAGRHLLGRHPGESEHPNLVSDVLPVAA